MPSPTKPLKTNPSSVVSLRLIADIGGTNARFGLVGDLDRGLLHIRELRTSEYPRIEDAIRGYLAQVYESHGVRQASLAIASPVAGDVIQITNNPWTFSINGIREALGFEAVRVLNDFAAVSLALPYLGSHDLSRVGEAPAPKGREDRTYAVLGPGTGLGVSGLVLRGERRAVIESEAGHVSFAPTTDYEIEIWRYLRRKYERVSVERLVSGSGLVDLHEAVCNIEGAHDTRVSAAEIERAATLENHPDCVRTLEVFCELLGGFAGDMALAYGAWDGVFLAGGVTLKLAPWIQRGGFRARFEAKGRHRKLVTRVPTWIVTHPHVGLLGAAVADISN